MKRLKLVLMVGTVMALLVVCSAAPAMAKGHGNGGGNGDHEGHADFKQDLRDFGFNRFGFNRFGFNNCGFFNCGFNNGVVFNNGFNDDFDNGCFNGCFNNGLHTAFFDNHNNCGWVQTLDLNTNQWVWVWQC